MSIQIVFWTLLSLLLFTYFGYPLVLAILAPLRPKPIIRQAPYEPLITIITPARNEAAHITAKIRNLSQLDYPAARTEILIIDDGSEDETVSRINCASHPGLRIISLGKRCGKAAAINRGVKEARGHIIVFTDADSLVERQALRYLVQPFVNPIIGCVAGQYFAGGAEGRNACGVGIYWKYENYLRRKESQVGGLLGASGSLYAVRRSLYVPLKKELINDDFIIPMMASAQGYRTIFEPRARAVEDESDNAQVEFSRRIRIMTGNCQHLWLFRHLLLNPLASRMGFQLFCHKFLRVMSPLMLLGAITLNIILVHGSPYGYLLGGQALFYLAAGMGYLVKCRSKACKLFTLPYYFTMINMSALLGIYYFLFHHSQVSWSAAAKPGRHAPGDGHAHLPNEPKETMENAA